MKSLLFLAGVGLLFAVRAQQFQNLGFESAKPPTDPAVYFTTAEEVLPGWTPYGVPRSDIPPQRYDPFILYNTVCLGSPCISVFGPVRSDRDFKRVPADGKYSVKLDIGGDSELGLRQIGIIPDATASLLLNASRLPSVRINETSLSPVLLSPRFPEGGDPGNGLWGFDVSPYSGQTVTLTVAISYQSFIQTGTFWTLDVDSLRFSNQTVVPEPPTFALLSLGIVVLLTSGRSVRR